MIVTPTVPGGLHGGDPGATAMAFFAVTDLDAAVARVRALGGEVVAMEESAETVTTWAEIRGLRADQGSTFGLHQPARGRSDPP